MILCKISLEFLEEHFSETVRCIGLKFSEITETVMPFQYSAFFIFLASSHSQKYMLMRQKVATKIHLYDKSI